MKNPIVTAIFPAAGQGKRLGAGKNKAFVEIGGRTMLELTLEIFSAVPRINDLIVVVAAAEVAEVQALLAANKKIKPFVVVAGGTERQHSVANGLNAVAPNTELVLVHDAARCFVTTAIIDRVIDAAIESGAAIAAVPAKDTVKVSDAAGNVAATPPRQSLWAVQTPQGFRRELLDYAYAKAAADGFLGTDDASLVERAGKPVKIVFGDYANIKITTPEDLLIAEAFLSKERKKMNRIGHGYDVHRLVAGRKLILGGVEIPHTTGLLGHSDADVLLHAIADALLGAAALGDIGRHFPDTDDKYKDADSRDLLRRVRELVGEKAYRIANIDATIIAQKPKLAPYISQMRKNIAATLGVADDQVNVKATTEEKLGFTGREEGIAAHAVCLLIR